MYVHSVYTPTGLYFQEDRRTNKTLHGYLYGMGGEQVLEIEGTPPNVPCFTFFYFEITLMFYRVKSCKTNLKIERIKGSK